MPVLLCFCWIYWRLTLAEQPGGDVSHIRLLEFKLFAAVSIDADEAESFDYGFNLEAHVREAVDEIPIVALVPELSQSNRVVDYISISPHEKYLCRSSALGARVSLRHLDTSISRFWAPAYLTAHSCAFNVNCAGSLVSMDAT